MVPVLLCVIINIGDLKWYLFYYVLLLTLVISTMLVDLSLQKGHNSASLASVYKRGHNSASLASVYKGDITLPV